MHDLPLSIAEHDSHLENAEKWLRHLFKHHFRGCHTNSLNIQRVLPVFAFLPLALFVLLLFWHIFPNFYLKSCSFQGCHRTIQIIGLKNLAMLKFWRSPWLFYSDVAPLKMHRFFFRDSWWDGGRWGTLDTSILGVSGFTCLAMNTHGGHTEEKRKRRCHRGEEDPGFLSLNRNI